MLRNENFHSFQSLSFDFMDYSLLSSEENFTEKKNISFHNLNLFISLSKKTKNKNAQ